MLIVLIQIVEVTVDNGPISLEGRSYRILKGLTKNIIGEQRNIRADRLVQGRWYFQVHDYEEAAKLKKELNHKVPPGLCSNFSYNLGKMIL